MAPDIGLRAHVTVLRPSDDMTRRCVAELCSVLRGRTVGHDIDVFGNREHSVVNFERIEFRMKTTGRARRKRAYTAMKAERATRARHARRARPGPGAAERGHTRHSARSVQ